VYCFELLVVVGASVNSYCASVHVHKNSPFNRTKYVYELTSWSEEL